MLFNTLQFALFLVAVVALLRSLPRSARNPFLLGASLLFYALWVPSYLLLLIVDVVVNYALLRGIARSAHRKLCLVISVVFTLGLLAYFKYAAFLVEAMAPGLHWSFGLEIPAPDILLPLGISFYSFQIIALAVDTYRGQADRVESLARYALFVSFFPQLIAGPILRGSQLLPQLARGAQPSPERTRRGLWLLASGVGKKVIVADFLLAPYVDSVFDAPGIASAPFHLIAAFSFAFQIYFDFSGYTDMARGMALLLGYELPFNFLEPYLARNPAEFWRRWHITLSRWLGDYLYIPLGGNRRGSPRTYGNLILTMLLGGLWHGAAWNFVIWGGLHGILLVIHRRFGKRSGDIDTPFSPGDFLRICLLFNAVSLIWIFFRAPTFDAACAFLTGLFTGGQTTGWPLFQTLILPLCFGSQLAERWLRTNRAEIHAWLAAHPWTAFLEAAAFGTLLGVAILVYGAGGEFIYFQF
jgi:alginate O-acetyltransferase complex protein AlgI